MPRARATVAAAETDLDDPDSYAPLDAKGMVGYALGFPAQVAHAAQIGAAFVRRTRLRRPRHIVLAGMGGSAVAGDFLARLCAGRSAVPFLVCRDYEIPAFVGPETLFIASSHSGDTEETLAAASEALRRRARIVCITTGGKLRRFARRHRGAGASLLQTPRTEPPMPPRAALGYSLIPLVYVLASVGAYPGAGEEVEESISVLERRRALLRPASPTRRNRAKRLAKDLCGKVPWVQGTAGIMSAAAYRWRCQFNENSKMLAYSSEYPELNHNEVVGWERADELSGRVRVIVLRSPADHWRNRARVRITKRELIGPKAPVDVVEAKGESALAQLMSVVYLGDFASLYLAFLNRVDPASVDSINKLKDALKRERKPRE